MDIFFDHGRICVFREFALTLCFHSASAPRTVRSKSTTVTDKALSNEKQESATRDKVLKCGCEAGDRVLKFGWDARDPKSTC
jgi:hypothetical protein